MDAFMEWLGYATIYALVVKAVLASTPTPPPDTLYGRLYRALEWSVLVIGKVKQEAGR